MAHMGKTQLTFVITSPPDLESEGDRIFAAHAPWMESTHHREGDKALLTYDVSKAPELSNPLDPTSEPTGNVHFILSEVYESDEGVKDHFEQAQNGWQQFPDLMAWMEKCDVKMVPAAKIFNSLW